MDAVGEGNNSQKGQIDMKSTLTPIALILSALLLQGCDLDGSSDEPLIEESSGGDESAGEEGDNDSSGDDSAGEEGDSDGSGEDSSEDADDSSSEIRSVSELNEAIAAAMAGDTLYLAADGVFDSGAVMVNKGVIIDGQDAAEFTGNACIYIQAYGATIQNLTLKMTELGIASAEADDATLLNECSVSTSDGQTGGITIDSINSDDFDASTDAVILDNLVFDASNTDDFGVKKASWIASFGLFELRDSEFIGLESNEQNNGIFVNCSRSDESRAGSVISDNDFTISTGGSSETAAIKVGDSSGSVIKTGNNESCNVTISGNTFNNYKVLQSSDLSSDSVDADNDPAAIFGHASALTHWDSNASTNTLNLPNG